MERLLRQGGLINFITGSPALLAQRMPRNWRSAEPCTIIWWLFTVSVVITFLPDSLGATSPFLFTILAIAGAGSCGWLWLLARTLFRAQKPIEPWTILAVAGIVGVEAFWALTSASGAGSVAGELRRITANAATLVCVGAIMLVFVEVLSGYRRTLSPAEKRFRQVFTAVFAIMIAISLGWAMNAGDMSFGAEWVESALVICALVGIGGSRLAVTYRKRNPLVAGTHRKVPQSPAAHNELLAQRILQSLEHEQRFATPELKVADLAAALGEKEYKVTQCITGSLGYRNFNQLINARRIEHAKQALTDPQQRSRPILSIALDCGFNSIGPFNRAFKREVGITPSAFRATGSAESD